MKDRAGGIGRELVARRALRIRARWSAPMGKSSALASMSLQMMCSRWPSKAHGDVLAGALHAERECDSAEGEAAGAVGLDHCPGRQPGGSDGGRGRGRSGRAGTAQPQLVQVGGCQVGGHGLDQGAVDEDVDAVLVGPDVRELPGAFGGPA